jgi:hypothetical protein
MKQFVTKVKNLSQKAAEIKAAMQQVPPKVAEIREAVTATAGQLQQLKHEIRFSVADLKAEQEDSLSEALQEINSSADVFAKAGFVLDGVDLELSPVQRALVHLLRVEEVHASVLRSLVQANQHRRTTRAILSALLQAKQMADTVAMGDLIYNEAIVGVGPIPSVRLCWRPEEVEAAPALPAAPAISSSAVAAVTPVTQAQSPFGASSFFERGAAKPATVAPPGAPAILVAAPAEKPARQVEPVAPAAVATDPLARFKKMPTLIRRDR